MFFSRNDISKVKNTLKVSSLKSEYIYSLNRDLNNNNHLLKRSVSELISDFYEINFIKLLNISYTDINSLNNNKNLRRRLSKV